MKKVLFSAILSISLSVVTLTAHANHGPGTTGGGASTVSGETLKEGQFVFGLDKL